MILSIQGSVLTLSPFYRFVPAKNYLPVNLPVNRRSGKFQKLAALHVMPETEKEFARSSEMTHEGYSRRKRIVALLP